MPARSETRYTGDGKRDGPNKNLTTTGTAEGKSGDLAAGITRKNGLGVYYEIKKKKKRGIPATQALENN